jgi:hypothetical protein
MCQSAQTSLVAWLVAVVISMIILTTGKKNAKWNAFFILTFITVQILEYFVWYFRKRDGLSSSADEARKAGCGSDKNRDAGDAIVRLIFIALWLQPLVQTYMAYRYGSGYKPQLMAITMVYFVMLLWAITQAMDHSATFKAAPVTCSKDSSGHLVWTRTNSPTSFVGPGPAGMLYIFGLFFGLFFMQPKLFGLILTTVGGVMVAYTSKSYAKGEFSSMWCLFAVFYAFIAFIMAYSRRKQA